MTLLDDLDKRRERANRDAENSARLAHCYATMITTGQGTTQLEKRVKFALTFIEKPIVGHAAECDVEELADIIGVDVDVVPLPNCTGYVTAWDRDERDFYVGCWIAARVNFSTLDGVATEALPVIEHHFTFSGIGLKDIPPDLEDATE